MLRQDDPLVRRSGTRDLCNGPALWYNSRERGHAPAAARLTSTTRRSRRTAAALTRSTSFPMPRVITWARFRRTFKRERLRSAAESTDALRRGAGASAWHRVAANLPCQNRWRAPGERQERTAFDEPDTSRDNAAMTIRTAFILMLASLATCAFAVTRGPATPTLSAEANDQRLVERGLGFAQRHCAACHAVESGGSPNPQAPPFEAVINQQGLSAETLKPWLRNSHDFPAMMNFAIDPEKIDELAAYMLTLKDPAYRPAIQ